MVGILVGVLALLLVVVLVAVLAAGGGRLDKFALKTLCLAAGSHSFRWGRGPRPQTATACHLQDSPKR